MKSELQAKPPWNKELHFRPLFLGSKYLLVESHGTHYIHFIK